MNALLAVQSPFSQSIIERLGWVLVHSLWQFAALGLVGAIFMRLLRHSSATARHGLLVIILAAAAMAPVATWLLQPASHSQIRERLDAFERRGANLASGATDFGNTAPASLTHDGAGPESKPIDRATIAPHFAVEVSLRERISRALEPCFPWIVGGWCVGVLLCSLRPLFGWRMLRRLRKIGISAPSNDVLAAFDRVSQRLGLRRAVQLLYSTLAKGPLLVGYFRPVVLLPASLVTNIPVSQLEAILAHELAHIRRHDFIINLLQTLIETLFFYHPAIWWLSHRIRIEREHCCDDLVVKLFNNRAEYGRALIAVEQLRDRATALALGATDGSLLARIRRIAGVDSDREVWMIDRWPTAIAIAIAIGIAVPLAMLRAADEKPAAPVQQPESHKPKDGAKLPGRLFVNAGLRTTKDEKHFSESAIAIDPNTGNWARLLNKSGFSVPLSPVRVSPDGRTMLFMRENDIWKCDAMTGENPVRVFQKGQPKAWAPDSMEFIVAVEKDASRSDSTENWRVSAYGNKKSLLPLSIGEVVEDWSPDGRWLVGWSHADGQLYIMKPDGTGRRKLTNTNSNASRNEHPRFSPDGRRIVYLQTLYQGADGAPDSRFSLRTVNIDGTDNREILGEKVAGPVSAKANWTAPMGARWSPDGKHLAVVLFDHTRGGGILAINGNWRLAIIDPDGGNLHELKLEGVLTTVLLGDGPEWRPTPPAVVTPEPKQGARLNPGAEEKLQWGEPMNGLRAAIAIRPDPGEPKASDMPDLYLAVQNVSKVPVRLNDTLAEQQPRMLYIKIDGKTQLGIGAKDPRFGDAMLQPREVAFLLLFTPDSKRSEGHTTGSIIAEGALKDAHQTLVAELKIERAPAGAWTGKLRTGETSGAVAAGKPQPKDKTAQALFKLWQYDARANGNIPGGLVGRLGDKVKEFIRLNTGDASGDPYAKKMKTIMPRIDPARDWTPSEVAALLDDIAAITPIPLDTTLDEAIGRTIKTGAPLPAALASAPWGDAQPNGLRMAWLLEPRAAEYRLGTPLKSRILIHNAEKDTVVFRTRTWHQSAAHKARDAKGAEIKIVSTSWTTIAPLMPFRLEPGEFVELSAAGIGVGPMNNSEDWQGTRVGSWIEPKAGDEVIFTPGAVPLSDWNEPPPKSGEPRWWRDFITARLHRELPLPADAEERKRMLYRIALDLFGTPLGAEETAAFLAVRDPSALDSLAKRLAHRAGLTPYAGSLQSGATKFRVLPADPDAAKKPRTASNPGRYTLAENAMFVVTRRADGERIVNEATIQFFARDPKDDAPAKPVAIKLSDGYNTWAAAWVRGGKVLWIQQKSGIRSYDFTNPALVKETTFEEPANFVDVPKPILDALHAESDLHGPPKPATETPKPPALMPR